MSRPEMQSRAQRGVSIIELMVGMVVALLVGLAAAGSAMMFTAQQRQGMGTGATSIGSASALSAIKEEISQAGLGFFGDSKYLCNAISLGNGAAVIKDNAAFAPVQVARVGGNDTVTVVYGDQIASGANVRLFASSNGASAQLVSLMPASVGQAVVLAPSDPSVAGTLCTVRTVTAVTDSTPTTPQILTFAGTGAHNQAALTIPTYSKEDRVALLGSLAWNTFGVNASKQLVMTRVMSGDSAVLATNVLAFRAEYGITATLAAGDHTLANWVSPDDAGWGSLDPAEVPQLRAMRLGIVTRSAQKDKPATPGDDTTCSATAAMPTLFGDAVASDMGAAWKCYRYRVTTMVIPLRNFVMGRD